MSTFSSHSHWRELQGKYHCKSAVYYGIVVITYRVVVFVSLFREKRLRNLKAERLRKVFFIPQEQLYKPKILIADDSEMNRAILTDMLGSDYDIIEAANGVEAIAALQKQSGDISLVLLDIMMPEMDGLEVLSIMNKHRWIDDVPVIIISAETASATIERAYELGISDFISRPFDAMIVRKRVVNTIMLYGKQKKLVALVADQIQERQQQNNLMIDILSHIVGFKNGESAQHVVHVRLITHLLLKALLQRTDQYPLDASTAACISIASALHDIGKIGIPDGILNKPGKLTPEEFEEVKRHSVIGAEILNDLPIYQEDPLVKAAREICRWHHERWDGRGYPDGLKGGEIPISAQIVALADVYDALTNVRSYKSAYPHDQAVEMILNGECGAFNPLLLECLKDIASILPEESSSHVLFQTSEKETKGLAEEMLRQRKLTTSDRTLHMLEQERIKTNFFASLTKEIQFEFTVEPPMVTLSAWGAESLGLPEVVMNPFQDAHVQSMIRSSDLEMLSKSLRSASLEQPTISYDCCLNLGGEDRWFRIVARVLWSPDEPPQYTGCVGKAFDIHDSHTKLKELERMATHDGLTGLYNTTHAKALIEKRLKSHTTSQFSLVIFDVDYFKSANDRLGHQFGNQVLVHMAETLRSCIRGSDVAARVGGDEYLLFLEYKSDLEPIIDRIFHSLTGNYLDFPISVSMGVSCSVGDELSYEELFHRADQALYTAKGQGRERYIFYDDSMKNMLSAISTIERKEREPR